MTPSQSSDESYKESTRTAWNATAEKYLKLLRHLEPYGFDLLARLSPKIRESALDVATGPGEPAMSIARMVGPDGRVVGIDLSEEMLEKAQDKVVELSLGNVTLKTMDATTMDFGQGEFDSAVATYTISAVPDPVGVLREMKRVVKPGGSIVVLNHFRSERRAVGRLEDLVAPICTRLGWKSNLPLGPLLTQVGLIPELVAKVNLFKGWRLVKCVNRK